MELTALQFSGYRTNDNNSGVVVKFRSKIASVAVATITSVGLFPAAAHAEVSRRQNVPMTLNGSTLSSQLNLTFHAGDCTEWGLNDQLSHHVAGVDLTLLDGSGDVEVHWHGVTRTQASFSADVWHAWFIFKSSAGVTLLSTQNNRLDSPGLDPTNAADTEFDRSQVLRMNPGNFGAISLVDYYGDC
jgi:hypothetical protein